jgi:large repetitive protein
VGTPVESRAGRWRTSAAIGAVLAGAALAIASAAATTSSAIEATEGSPLSGQVATASAPCTPVSTPTATITWGDGGQSAATPITVSGATLAINGSHTYAEEGSYSGSVSGSYLCDGDQVPFRATFTVQVVDAPLQGSAASHPALVAGSTFSGTVATFTDANPQATVGDYRIGVAWGDGRSSTAIGD